MAKIFNLKLQLLHRYCLIFYWVVTHFLPASAFQISCRARSASMSNKCSDKLPLVCSSQASLSQLQGCRN
jgi:hypothetical protein